MFSTGSNSCLLSCPSFRGIVWPFQNGHVGQSRSQTMNELKSVYEHVHSGLDPSSNLAITLSLAWSWTVFVAGHYWTFPFLSSACRDHRSTSFIPEVVQFALFRLDFRDCHQSNFVFLPLFSRDCEFSKLTFIRVSVITADHWNGHTRFTAAVLTIQTSWLAIKKSIMVQILFAPWGPRAISQSSTSVQVCQSPSCN